MAQDALPPLGVDAWGASHVDEAIINAEQNYRNGSGPGVTLEELRVSHNHLMDAVGMPAHTKVNLEQLGHIYVYLQFLVPKIMGGVSPKPGEPQDRMTHILSPYAAAYLEQFLLLQKRWNVAYQFAPGEWTVQKAIDASKRPETYPIRPSPESREINTKLRASIHLDDAEAAKLLLHAKETFNLSAVDVAKIAAARTKGHDA